MLGFTYPGSGFPAGLLVPGEFLPPPPPPDETRVAHGGPTFADLQQHVEARALALDSGATASAVGTVDNSAADVQEMIDAGML